ncbi:RRP12 protein [Trifolium repens]|nr:RRP12 protein [Trifolium repens]
MEEDIKLEESTFTIHDESNDDLYNSILSRFTNFTLHDHWSDVSPLFNKLLGFLTDSRPKIRRQSHLCLRDVLIILQKSSLLESASEGVVNLLERFLLIASGANANAGEGTKGAQQVLYILDALKECLPLLSLKYKNNILKHFKNLLVLRQPLVTRRITDGLSFLCLYPTSEVSPEALLEVLCTLSALSTSSNEMSGDGMTFTARLLDAGMKKVFSLDRQMCVIKLPSVFNDLKDILASEHEEAIFAASDALKSMINYCIDDSLIKQGVDQITLDDSRMSRPTVIEKICATFESLLGYHYIAAWDRVFEVVSAMFHKLGSNSPYLMRGILKNLEDMQQLPDEDFPFRKQLHACLGSAVVAMGPETLLSLMPLNLEAEDLSVSNRWLIPILKQYIVGARLKYFTEEILPMIERLQKQGLVVSSRNLWSLLPSFCNYPSDTAKSFEDLEKHLRSKLKEEPDIRGIICTSLQLLIRKNKNIKDSYDKDDIGQDMANEQVLVNYSQQVATENLRALEVYAKNLLKVLSDVFLKSTKDDGGCLQGTIGDIASIAEKKVVQNLFKKKMSDLLKCTQKANKVDNSESSMQIDESNDVSQSVLRARLLDFAVSLLPGLDAEDIDLLFQVIKPALQDVGVMQKKAYKVLSIMLRSSDSFVLSKLEVLLGLMVESLPCHSSAKRHRLDCLYFLIAHVLKSEAVKVDFLYFLTVHDSKSKDDSMTWPEVFLTEIILALKEANKKTRNRAYEILVEIAHAVGDEERGGNTNNLYQFFIKVAGGLVGKTPHMISATVKGLARLAYEFPDLVLTAFDLLPSTFTLLEKKNREITKANLGLLKVLVAKSQAEGLQVHLRSVVECLFKWQDDAKNHFKAKVKFLLGMLIAKCGLEAVKAVMPEEHMKLLSNIRKIKERKERNQGAKSEETRSHVSKATTSRQSRWNHTDIFLDFDGESAAGSDDPLDLLDRQKTRSALRWSEHGKRKSRLDDDEMEVDSEGRLIIRDEGEQAKEKSAESDYDARNEPDSHLSARSGTKPQKRRRRTESGRAYTGKEYASKKASGDIKRKDKLEPYAYWQLDRKMMSRRPQHRAAAKKGMASVVNMTKRLEGKSASDALKLKRFWLELAELNSEPHYALSELDSEHVEMHLLQTRKLQNSRVTNVCPAGEVR